MTPRVLLVASLVFTLIFNVAWAAGQNSPGPGKTLVPLLEVNPAGFWLSILAAAVCTLIVPAGLHLWPQIPAPTWQLRWLRALVMGGICVAAAITSFSHSVHVLMSAGWDVWTACSVTGGAELLVALSTMALRPADLRTTAGRSGSGQPTDTAASAGPDSADAVPVPATGQVPVPGADTPTSPQRTTVPDRPSTPSAPPRPLRVADPDRSAQLRAWVEETGEIPTESAVRKRFGCRQSVAQRLLAELGDDAEEEAG